MIWAASKENIVCFILLKDLVSTYGVEEVQIRYHTSHDRYHLLLQSTFVTQKRTLLFTQGPVLLLVAAQINK
jgi:hypothetical protein